MTPERLRTRIPDNDSWVFQKPLSRLERANSRLSLPMKLGLKSVSSSSVAPLGGGVGGSVPDATPTAGLEDRGISELRGAGGSVEGE